MCSVSWVRRRDSLLVVMNRDERRDRAPARPPRRWRGADGGFTAPLDGEAGGTWIAAKDSGVVLALLNHHGPGGSGGRGLHRADHADVAGGVRRISRGLLVTALAAQEAPPDAARLRAAGLAAYAPFRLFVAGRQLPPRVFTWNGARLSVRRLDARVGFLTSSSWNPSAVIPARQARFRAFRRGHPRPTRADLVAFHASADDPRGTPWAVCMSRDDARTVSRTVVEVTTAGVTMRYRALTRPGAA
jgi:hypothetical protein